MNNEKATIGTVHRDCEASTAPAKLTISTHNMILSEYYRQKNKYTTEDDLPYTDNQLLLAAEAYLECARFQNRGMGPLHIQTGMRFYPNEFGGPTAGIEKIQGNPIDNLCRGIALQMREIDRLRLVKERG